jgi:tight adherence protein C
VTPTVALLLVAAVAAIVALVRPRALASPRLGRAAPVAGVVLVATVRAGLVTACVAAVASAALADLLWRRRIAAGLERRRAAIEAELPDVLDLLAGVVEAGVPLDAALAAVRSAARGPLRDELSACVARLAGGGARREAFAALAASGAPDLARVGASLATSDELGAPLSALLRDQASLQRELRRMHVRERAARAAPKMALVVSFLLVPAGLALVLGSQVLGMLAQLHPP